MTRDSRERLKDIAEAVAFIESHVGGSLESPDIVDPKTLHAVLFNLLVIGEAAKNVDDELRREAPEVRWRDYRGDGSEGPADAPRRRGAAVGIGRGG